MLRTVHAAFLRNGEDDLQWAVRNLLLLQLTQSFENGFDTGFVITAEDGIALRTDHAIFQYRPDAAAWLDTIHMCREHNRLSARHRGGEIRYDIACIAAKFLTGFIFMNGAGSERLQFLFQDIGDLPLVMR